MTISNQRIVQYQNIHKEYLGIEISFERAKIDALHLLRVLLILRGKQI